MRIVVNTITTKKHSGGAYQIALNFILETLKHPEVEWYYITSSDVDELVGSQFESIKGTRYFVFPTQPDFLGSYHQVKKDLSKWEDEYKPDIIYTISSPSYFKYKSTEVMRFANAWLTNPNKESWKRLSLLERIYNYFHFAYQRRYLKRGNYFVTQSETVGRALECISKQPKSHIKVVPNVLPAAFNEASTEKKWSSNWIDVACIGNAFPQKNFGIVPKVLERLKNAGITNVRFHMTIPEGNSLLKKIKSDCRNIGLSQNVISHGRCTQQQLIAIYNQCRLCFLPTLLETFSASSLEAMYFGLNIVATDYDFNREVISDAGLYYSSLDAEDAACQFIRYINDEDLCSSMREKMKDRIKLYNSYENHFIAILDFLKEVAK